MGALYSINFPNGKRYIGVTTGRASRRFRQHRNDALRGDQLVNRAVRKFGLDQVDFQVLAVADDRAYLAEIERRAIDAFGTLTPGGYNTIPGGGIAPGKYTMPESEKAKRRGRKASLETRAKMSAAHLGKKRPESYSAKLSERNKGNRYSRGRWLTAAGAYWRPSQHKNGVGRWIASIRVDGKARHLGSFTTKDEAVAAHRVAAEALWRGGS